MRVGDYPIPNYACYFWHRGDALIVQFPDYETQHSHSLAIPIEKLGNEAGIPAGIRALLDLMSKRRNDYLAGDKPKIGWDSEPTQEMLNTYMKLAYKPPKCTVVEEDIFAEEPTDAGNDAAA